MSEGSSAPAAEVERVAAGLAGVRRRIADAGGDPGCVRVVAVTKGFGLTSVEAALAAGLEDVGENYARELRGKAAAWSAAPGRAPHRPTWHYLGRIQRRQVPALAPLVDCWQGVAREAEAETIARRRPGATVLVQVDVTGCEGRNGCSPAEAPAVVRSGRTLGLDVRGLMTVAPRDPEAARRAFAEVCDLADRLGLPERSMGMSDDLELAVAAGSTMVRVGRALFGERPAPAGRLR